MAHLLIIELPGGNDTDILDAALARGDEVTFVSAALEHYRQQAAVAAMLARLTRVIEINPFNDDALQREVQALHRQQPLDAVLCLVDTRVPHAARLAASLGLPGLDPASAQRLRDKYEIRCHLREQGITQPAFALACNNEELQQAVATLGLPLLIKPADGYGSQNIVVLRHEEDLDPLLSPLEHMLPSHADYGLGVKANDRLLVERLLDGTIIGCDTLSRNGQHQLLGIHEKSFVPAPSFTIRGGCFTPAHPGFADIEHYLFTLLDAVGFNHGAAHTELILGADGPRLIEINPRLVGARIPRLVSLALGYSHHQAVIALHCGQALPVPGKARVAVSRWLLGRESGRLRRLQLPDWHDPRILGVDVVKAVGADIRPPFDNSDRLACVMVCADSRAQAEQLADRYLADCRILLD